jgi:hypothetical protein
LRLDSEPRKRRADVVSLTWRPLPLPLPCRRKKIPEEFSRNPFSPCYSRPVNKNCPEKTEIETAIRDSMASGLDRVDVHVADIDDAIHALYSMPRVYELVVTPPLHEHDLDRCDWTECGISGCRRPAGSRLGLDDGFRLRLVVRL